MSSSPSPSVKLRPATLSDAETIASIHIANWKHSYQNMLPAWYMENELDKDRMDYWHKTMMKHTQEENGSNKKIIMMAENDKDQVVGFFAGEWDPTCERGAYLENIHTLPQYQGIGAGRLMMDAFKQWAKQMGAQQVYLFVLAQNDQAIAFYERGGWQFADSLLSGPVEGIQVPTRIYTLRQL